MKQITAKEVESLFQSGQTVNIIDVRETDEVAEGQIPDVLNVPLGLLEFRMHELDKTKEYVLVCHSGNRSGIATKFLESHGFNVMNMTGGMMAWEGKVV